MILVRSLVMAAAALMLISAPTHADERPPKKLVEDLSKIAHEAFLTVKNNEGQTIVKAEDAKKLKFPIISYEEREMAVARGYISEAAQWCGLEWQKDYFKPYLRALQLEHKKSWTPHQYAYAEVLHGVAMGTSAQDHKGKKCPDAEKKRIAALAKK